MIGYCDNCSKYYLIDDSDYSYQKDCDYYAYVCPHCGEEFSTWIEDESEAFDEIENLNELLESTRKAEDITKKILTYYDNNKTLEKEDLFNLLDKNEKEYMGNLIKQCNYLKAKNYLVSIPRTKDYAVLLKTDDTFEISKPKERYFKLDELQRCVEGFVESVNCGVIGECLEFINEEGFIKKLPVNNLGRRLLARTYRGNILVCPKNLVDTDE